MTTEQGWKMSEAESYLRRVRGAQHRIRTLTASISDIYCEIEGIKAIDYSSIRVTGGGSPDAMAALISEKDQRMRECQEKAHDLECEVRRAQLALSRMADQSYAALLECHYINGLSWIETARDLGYSVSHAHRLKEPALVAFHEVMPVRDKVELPSAI